MTPDTTPTAFDGRLVLPADPDWDDARVGRTFNGRRPDRQPDAVLLAASVADVQSGVRLAAQKGCIAVPTLVAYEGLWLDGKELGFGDAEFAKIDVVRQGGLRSLEIMRDAGLPMAFGSDLLGELRKYHCMEFELLAKVLTPAEIIRSATIVGAELCRMTGEVGVIAAGAHADLIVVDGDPLADLSLLQDDGRHLPLIMRGGQVFKEQL